MKKPKSQGWPFLCGYSPQFDERRGGSIKCLGNYVKTRMIRYGGQNLQDRRDHQNLLVLQRLRKPQDHPNRLLPLDTNTIGWINSQHGLSLLRRIFGDFMRACYVPSLHHVTRRNNCYFVKCVEVE